MPEGHLLIPSHALSCRFIYGDRQFYVDGRQSDLAGDIWDWNLDLGVGPHHRFGPRTARRNGDGTLWLDEGRRSSWRSLNPPSIKQGQVMIGFSLGSLIGPPIGGVLYNRLGYRVSHLMALREPDRGAELRNRSGAFYFRSVPLCVLLSLSPRPVGTDSSGSVL